MGDLAPGLQPLQPSVLGGIQALDQQVIPRLHTDGLRDEARSDTLISAPSLHCHPPPTSIPLPPCATLPLLTPVSSLRTEHYVERAPRTRCTVYSRCWSQGTLTTSQCCRDLCNCAVICHITQI